MDKKSKIFFFILLSAMTIATVLSYYRYVIRHDYRVEGEPAMEEDMGTQSESGVPSLNE